MLWKIILLPPLLFHTSQGLVNSDSECPEHWLDASLTGMGCLLFNSSAELTWEESSFACHQSNSSLLEIWTEVQLDYVREEVSFLADASSWLDQDWWTSGTDLGREGHWYWASSLAPIADFVWHSGQPDNRPSSDEGTGANCLILENSMDFMAQDERCSYTTFHICQKK